MISHQKNTKHHEFTPCLSITWMHTTNKKTQKRKERKMRPPKSCQSELKHATLTLMTTPGHGKSASITMALRKEQCASSAVPRSIGEGWILGFHPAEEVWAHSRQCLQQGNNVRAPALLGTTSAPSQFPPWGTQTATAWGRGLTSGGRRMVMARGPPESQSVKFVIDIIQN